MHRGVVVRPVRPEDIPDITAIYAHAVEHGTASFEITPPSEAEIAARKKRLLDSGYPYFVAEAGHGIVGFAYAGLYRPRVAYRHTVEDSIYVHPRALGQGIGRMLLAELIAECTRRGFRQMIALIGDSEQTASIALHRAQGFITAGTLKTIGFKHHRWLDSVLMQRPLGDGGDTMPSGRLLQARK